MLAYVKSRNSLTSLSFQRFSPLLLPKFFIVSIFILKSIIYFELIFVYETQAEVHFIYLPPDVQLLRHHLLKGNFFSIKLLLPFCQKSVEQPAYSLYNSSKFVLKSLLKSLQKCVSFKVPKKYLFHLS